MNLMTVPVDVDPSGEGRGFFDVYDSDRKLFTNSRGFLVACKVPSNQVREVWLHYKKVSPINQSVWRDRLRQAFPHLLGIGDILRSVWRSPPTNPMKTIKEQVDEILTYGHQIATNYRTKTASK